MERRRILITGGSGFAGGHMIEHWMNKYRDDIVLNVDCYDNVNSICQVTDIHEREGYRSSPVDLRDADDVVDVVKRFDPHGVIHFTEAPCGVLWWNVFGTFNLLDACRQVWGRNCEARRVVLVSSYKVFGNAPCGLLYRETTQYQPSSVKAASKAAVAHLGRAYTVSHDMDIVVAQCANSYGARQSVEKFIPTVIRSAARHIPIPLNSDGKQERDWTSVQDIVVALDLLFHRGVMGESYCVGTGYTRSNLCVAQLICRMMDELVHKDERYRAFRMPDGNRFESLIAHIDAVKGEDFRYGLDPSKMKWGLGWETKIPLDQGLCETVQWYLDDLIRASDCTKGVGQ